MATRHIRQFVALCATAAAAALLPAGPVQAACQISSNTTTCSGDVYPFSDLQPGGSDAFTYVFENLTGNATNGASTEVINIQSIGDAGSDGTNKVGVSGAPLAITFDGGDFGLSSTANGALFVTQGGAGKDGESRTHDFGGDVSGGDGGAGGAGGDLSTTWTLGDIDAAGFGIRQESLGGAGGAGGKGATTAGEAKGGKGGAGGTGGAVNFDLGGDVTIVLSDPSTSGDGLAAHSIGGDGGKGGNASGTFGSSKAGDGGDGGAGGDVTITTTGGLISVTTVADQSDAVHALSLGSNGGKGGNGDTAVGTKAKGGDGGIGGNGGVVLVDLETAALGIVTSGDQSQGVFARSYGGNGGDGGNGAGGLAAGKGGAAKGPGNGGAVSVTITGVVATSGTEANAILVQSIGGFAGDAGSSSGFVAYGAGAQSGGLGSDVTVTLGGGTMIMTSGSTSVGVLAQSVGGGGGRGSSGDGIVVLGGTGSAGGDGGVVTVTSKGASITTGGTLADAIQAMSIGGTGGSAGASEGVVSLGGEAGSGGSGGAVEVNNTASLTTVGDQADGLFAQSVGGGGGKAHSTDGIVALGGSGGDGGTGGNVDVTLGTDAVVTTQGNDADAIYLQSVGGGGGSGSSSLAPGIEFSVAYGGSGGSGGDGGNVTFTNGADAATLSLADVDYTIVTGGDRARGVFAQSIGGGGGDGGNAISASAGLAVDVALGASGGGATAGSGGTVMVTVGDNIMTSGNNAAGIFAQSAGGGGGSAGNTISSANGYSISAGVALGGTGGSAGAAGAVSVVANGAVDTAGKSSSAIVAQSVGGGGGHSGVTISGNAITLAGASIALGGAGGAGGDANTVEVEANGPLATGGAGSDAVLAQSIGGSGGAANTVIAATGLGGTASADIGIGASGGSGGNGGIVDVTVADTIATGGDNSYGITAQSIGGGGGNGSITISGSFAAMSDANIAVGGDGGGSGTGGDVTVSAGGITTSGYDSVGILAQSISNAGGNGGFTIDGSGLSGGNVGVAVAGSGGSGGSSGDVKVSVGSVATAGNAATGVMAMSVAGGGGSAMGGVSGTVASMGEVGVTIGGSGGSGGKAGTVKITADGVIKTIGDSADGIFALSQGGSGGDGGFAIEGSLTAGEYSGTANVTIGGGGGNGGSGGIVTVANTEADGPSPSISVVGYSSRGIAAQSIGGSGGNGGSVYSGNLTVSSTLGIQLGVNVGGAGGTGAVGGGVKVSNDGAIETSGIYGDAIFGQSIGGDGGVGGSSYSVAVQATTSSTATVMTSVGGTGGSGNNGGKVVVSNSAALTTTADAAAGIYSQSVGGGGGRGGNAASLMFDFTKPPTEGTTVQFNADIAVGGSGGAGGDGGVVKVTNGGAIDTGGKTSWGIFAQSVGGGGGDGGSVSSQVLTVNGQCILTSTFGFSCTSADGTQTNYEPSLQIVIGGQGGAGGNGGAVTVDNNEAITTGGYDATAIFAQSVGGGGGTGGYSNIGIAAWAPNAIVADINEIIGTSRQVANLTSYQNLRVVVGGQGGAAGDGGDLSVKNSAAVSTTGDSAYAVFAQSVGGGGGNGGNALGSVGTLLSVNVGGAGSGGGNGGAVSVTSSGPIHTIGDGSVAIFAQSVGGGGGSAGDIEAALNHSWADLNIGISVGVQLAAGNGGNGGDVKIKLSDDGTITTTGENAHGIFAQSVGGSGGAAGLTGALGGGVTVFAGSTGDAGKGGNIKIRTSGTAINVSGTGAEGIFAQSVSGAKSTSTLSSTAGTIDVHVTADVIASGENGRAMLLQSQGFEGNGTITVTVGKKATVSTAKNGYETIGFLDGLNNTLTNAGTIEKPEGGSLTGYVVRAEGGQLTIANNGTLNGSIALDSSYVNRLVNNGDLGLGLTVDLGKKSILKNGGMMSAGTVGTIGNSTVTGALTQSSHGIFHVDFAFAGGNDLITTTSDSAAPELAGTVVPAPLFKTLPQNGDKGSFAILKGQSGIAANSLTVDSTATINYQLSQKALSGAGQKVVLSYDVNYAPWNAWALPPGLHITQNDTNFGNYVNDLVKARQRAINSGTDKLAFVDDLTLYILNIQDVTDLVDVYNRYAPAALFAPDDAALFSSFGFADSLNSCPDQNASGTAVFTRDGSCIWAELGGTASRSDTHGGSAGFNENAFNAAGGIQSEIVDGMFAGFAFGYQSSTLSNNMFNGNGDRYQVGGSLKKEWGNSTLSASLSGGLGNYDLTHQILTPNGAETAHSSPDTSWLAAHARLSHVFDITDQAYVKPWIDVGVDRQWQGAFKSKTGDAYGIDVGSTDATFVSLNPMVEFGTVFDVMGRATEADFRAGALSIVSGNGWSAKARLHGAGGAGPTYTISDKVNPLFAQVGASIKTQVNRNVTVELGFDGLFSTYQQQYAGTTRLNVNF